MFDSLIKPRINWIVFFTVSFLTLLVPGISIFSVLAIMMALHQFLLLYGALNYVIPTRYLFGFLMCVQMFIGPVLVYNGVRQGINFRMQIPEFDYFLYAFPAVCCFILGLNYKTQDLKGELLDSKSIIRLVDRNVHLPYIFIVIGFLSSFLANFFSTDLAFLIYLIGSLKYIGVFILIISDRKVKLLPMIIVYGSIISSSLGTAMFHDLITWLIFLGAIYCIKYKPKNWIKLLFSVVFVAGIILIQQLKVTYRSTTIGTGRSGSVTALADAYQEEQASSDNNIFSLESLAPSVVRINQGFIVTYIMKMVPTVLPFEYGSEMLQIFEAALFPRIVDPTKLKAGDKEIFKKYTGIYLSQNTSMALSSLGDAYINFGVVGGIIFMFLLGLLYNHTLKKIGDYTKYYPLLVIFSPLVFYYPIRPDCELQTILGHFVKSLFLLFLIMKIWNKNLKVNVPAIKMNPGIAS